jgi:hypothetical protein
MLNPTESLSYEDRVKNKIKHYYFNIKIDLWVYTITL